MNLFIFLFSQKKKKPPHVIFKRNSQNGPLNRAWGELGLLDWFLKVSVSLAQSNTSWAWSWAWANRQPDHSTPKYAYLYLHGCSPSCQQRVPFLSNGGFRVCQDVQNDAVSIHSKERFFRGFQKRCLPGSDRRRRTRRSRSLYPSHQTWYSPNPNYLFGFIENQNLWLVSLFSFFSRWQRGNVSYSGDLMKHHIVSI